MLNKAMLLCVQETLLGDTKNSREIDNRRKMKVVLLGLSLRQALALIPQEEAHNNVSPYDLLRSDQSVQQTANI